MRSVDQQVQPKDRDIVKEIGTQASAGNQDTKYCEEIHCSGVFSMVWHSRKIKSNPFPTTAEIWNTFHKSNFKPGLYFLVFTLKIFPL